MTVLSMACAVCSMRSSAAVRSSSLAVAEEDGPARSPAAEGESWGGRSGPPWFGGARNWTMLVELRLEMRRHQDDAIGR